jgi:hypothetical protein
MLATISNLKASVTSLTDNGGGSDPSGGDLMLTSSEWTTLPGSITITSGTRSPNSGIGLRRSR